MKAPMIVRNRIASWCGLEAPTATEIISPEMRTSYVVGDKIGGWPIFALTDTELVAGRDNRHLDFRLSILKEFNADAFAGATRESTSMVISTVCTVHNMFGKLYLVVIIPFHQWGVQKLIARAIAAGRL
jgi:hypothetical protein